MNDFNAKHLRTLAKNSDKTIGALRESEPELFNAIAQMASNEVRTAIVKKFARSSSAIRKAVLKIDAAELGERPTGKVVREHLLAILRQDNADRDTIEEARGAIRDAELITTPADAIPDRTPINVNPAFTHTLATARLVSLGETANLRESALEGLVQANLTEHALTDPKLRELVRQDVLRNSEAQSLARLS